MKPISVEFQAFGPYENKEFIDFEALSKDGLFLIDGKTGSGKTMILDAITFALYGKSSGSTRDNLEQLRCSHCNPKDDTYVKFTFEEKGSRYVFERRLTMKRVNLSSEFHALKVESDGTERPIFENCKSCNMTEKAEELIGLTFDQFRQVIILPQGKFERLLTSDSKDKEAILAQIFNTGKWQTIAEKYMEKAKNANDKLVSIKTRVDSSLAEDGCKNLSELEQKAASLLDEMKLAEEEFKKADYTARKNKLSDQKALAKDFDTLENYNANLAALKAKEGVIEENKKRLEKAEKAEVLRKPFDSLSAALDELKKRKEAETSTNKEFEEAKVRKEKAETAVAEHKKKEKEHNDNKTKKTSLELKKETYESINNLEAKLKETENKRVVLLKEAENLEEKSKEAVEVLSKSLEELNKAELNEKTVRDSYMSGIKGHLAEDLEEGEVCPVCGNTHHPKLAEIPEGSANAKDVENAEKNTNDKKEVWKKADDERLKAEDKLKTKKEELATATTSYETAKNDVLNARKSLVDGIDSLESFKNELIRLSGLISSYDDEEAKLKEELELANKEIAAAIKGVENSKTETEKANKAVEEANAVLEKALKETAFETEEAAKSAMLDAEDMNKLRTSINEHDTKVKEYSKLSTELSKELEGKTAPDIGAIDVEIFEIEKAEKEYNTQLGKNTEYHGHLSNKHKELSKEYEIYENEIKAVQSNLTFAKMLRGDTGVGLQRYVLGIMFSSVIHSANEMLKNVAGGRYTLFRTSEKVDSGNKRGLDLMVLDSYGGNKEGRSVSTLSGGEKFLVSLALSIGLAGIAKTGGVDIEGIFIDEGFGTLDEDCIGDALDILNRVQKANGLVGIISHVELLRSTIYPQVQVKVDEKKASHIEIC